MESKAAVPQPLLSWLEFIGKFRGATERTVNIQSAFAKAIRGEF